MAQEPEGTPTEGFDPNEARDLSSSGFTEEELAAGVAASRSNASEYSDFGFTEEELASGVVSSRGEELSASETMFSSVEPRRMEDALNMNLGPQDLQETPITLPIGDMEFEAMLAEIESDMRESGNYSEKEIQQLVMPLNPDGLPAFNEEKIQQFYSEYGNTLSENSRIIYEAQEAGESIQAGGLQLRPDNWSGLRLLVSNSPDQYTTTARALALGGKAMGDKISEGYSWVDKKTGHMVFPVIAQSAMAALDGFVRVVNKTRFELAKTQLGGGLTQEEESLLRERLLPPVRVRNSVGEEKLYSSQISARLHLAGEILGNSFEWTFGRGTEMFGEIFHNDEWKSWGKMTAEERGFIDYETAAMHPAIGGQIPEVVAPLDILMEAQTPTAAARMLLNRLYPYTEGEVQHDPYLRRGSYSGIPNEISPERREEIVRKVEEEGDLWPVWSEYHDAGTHGQAVMASLAQDNVFLELSVDPAFALSFLKIPSHLHKGLRGLAEVVDVQRAAKYARVGRKWTNTVENASESVRLTKKAASQLEKQALKEAHELGDTTPQTARKLVQQRRNLEVEGRNLSRMQKGIKAATEDELGVLERIKRRNPKFIPKLRDPKVKHLVLREADAEVNLMGPVRELPPEMKIAKEGRMKSVLEVQEEMAAGRKLELERDFDVALEVTKLDDPITKQRSLFGPDDMEASGDALNHIIRTGGYGVEDVAIPSHNPTYRWDAMKVVSNYDWSKAGNVLATERRAGLARGGAIQWELGESANRVITREEDRIRRALGAARRFKLNDGSIQALEKELDDVVELGKTYKKKSAKRGKVTKAKAKVDESWTGQQPTNWMRDPNKVEKFLNNFADGYVRGLYPGAIRERVGRSSLMSKFQFMRDPVRYLETWDPEAAEHLRLSQAQHEQFVTAQTERVQGIFIDSGIVRTKRKVDPTRLRADVEIDKARSEQLFDLLDTRRGTDEFDELWEVADESMRRGHDRLRYMLDDLADRQGIADTSRYLQGYIMHIISESGLGNGLRPREFMGLSGNAEVFVKHLLDRKGFTDYERDVVAAMDLYIRGAGRELHTKPLLADLQRIGDSIANRTGMQQHKNYMNAVIDNISGKPSYVGDILDRLNPWAVRQTSDGGQEAAKVSTQGSWVERIVSGISSLIWSASIPGNPRYLLMQMSSGTTTTAGRFGGMRTAGGMLQMMTSEGQDMAKELGFFRTVDDLMESNSLRQMSTTLSEWTGIERIEALSRGAAAHASLSAEMTTLGLTTWREAVATGVHHRLMFNALRAAEETNHAFGPLARTPWLNRAFGQPIGTAASQFTLYPIKQTEVLASMADQNWGKVAEYFILGGYITRVFAQHTGIDMSQWTGAGFATEMMEQGVPISPTFDLAVSWATFGDAPRRGKRATDEAADGFKKSIEVFLPVLIRNLKKRNQRLNEHKAIDKNERKVRELFHGESDNVIRKIAESIRPSMEPDGMPVGTAQGVGGDLIPDFMMLPSIRDRMQRNADKAARNVNAVIAAKIRDFVKEYADAYENEEWERANELSREIARKTNNRVRLGDIGTSLVNEFEARNIAGNFRHIAENGDYADLFWEIYEMGGVGTGENP